MTETYDIGDASVTLVRETVLVDFAPETLFSNWTEAAGRDLVQLFGEDADSPRIPLSVHTWVVRLPGLVALVDTGVGNSKPRPHAPYFDQLDHPFLENLEAAGIAPEDVDLVLLTHLHVDHVGWNTRLSGDRWVPTFPNARYVFSRKEHAVFTDPANLTDATRTSFQVQTDSIEPVIAAGLADRIEIDGPTPYGPFVFHPTPGHSPDHASISLARSSTTAFFPGDTFHHPVEVLHPELMTIFDRTPGVIRTSRERGFAFAADHDALVFTSHAPGSAVGRISREGEGWAWTPAKHAATYDLSCPHRLLSASGRRR